jgi:hypothetical protein
VAIAVFSLSADLKNMDLNFRAEFFNLVNHPQFGLLVGRVAHAGFDRTTFSFPNRIADVFRNRTPVVFDWCRQTLP